MFYSGRFSSVLVLNMDDLSWLLVATKPRGEFVARQHLERQGFEVCLPQITLRKRKQGKWQQVTEPLFPGYVFVGVVLGAQDIAPIRSTQGCLQVVRFGGQLVPLPDDVMQRLLTYDTAPRQHSPTFSEGQAVCIESGPFAGLEVVFDKWKGADRVYVLVEILGKVRSVAVPASVASPL